MLRRMINIMSKPVDEWHVIAEEESSVGSIFFGFYVPLAILQPLASILAVCVFGIGTALLEQNGISATLSTVTLREIIGYILGLLGFYAIALLGSIMAPSFGGKSNLARSMKVFAYASCPALLGAAIVPFFGQLPVLWVLLVFASMGYAFYLIHLGAGPVMAIPKEKLAGFTVVVLAIYIALALIMHGITSMVEGLSIF